jgi:hypothetical protein
MSAEQKTAWRYLVGATILGGVGTLFSGFLSWVRAASGICAFDEACPFFLGQPACYTGLALFATVLVVSGSALAAKVEAAWPLAANFAVAVAGTLFASTLTRDEVVNHASYSLGLPTCAWGLLFFVGLLVWSIAEATRRAGRETHDEQIAAH